MKALELIGETVRFGFELKGTRRWVAVAGLACAGGDTSNVAPQEADSGVADCKISQASAGVIRLIRS